MTWDDFDGPSVLTPLDDFFCIGHSMQVFHHCHLMYHLVRVKKETFGGTAAMNCYFPMPFNKRAKIEMGNENERPLGLFFHVTMNYIMRKQKNIAYFQAAWGRRTCLVLDGETTFVLILQR